jgi:hypothetical protein
VLATTANIVIPICIVRATDGNIVFSIYLCFATDVKYCYLENHSLVFLLFLEIVLATITHDGRSSILHFVIYITDIVTTGLVDTSPCARHPC